MFALMLLAASAWTDAPDEGGVKLMPKYTAGQEIVYSGTIIETCTGAHGVTYEQPYDLEMTALVTQMDGKRNAEMACYTLVRMPNQDADAPQKSMDDVSTFHFDMMRVSPMGAATWMAGPMKGKTPAPTPSGQAPWELACFLQTPSEPVAPGQKWVVECEGQPPTRCTMIGPEPIDGEACMKVVCTQQSPAWGVKNAMQPSWLCDMTVWVTMKKGMVYKVSRNFLMRDAGEETPTRWVKTSYTQATNIVFNGPELQDRTTDFDAALKAQIEWEKLAAGKSDRTPKNQIGAVRHQLQFALDKSTASPYRMAMKEMLRVAEEAEKTVVLSKPTLPPAMPHAAAVVGKRARYLAVREIDSGALLTLKNFKGKCVCLVYCDAEVPVACKALQTVLETAKTCKEPCDVYAVCMKTDAESMAMLKKMVPGAYKICKAAAMDRSYGMVATPHTIMIDKDGALRANFLGYGPELAASIAQQLDKPAKIEQIGSQPGKMIR